MTDDWKPLKEKPPHPMPVLFYMKRLDGEEIYKTDFRDEAYALGFWLDEFGFCYNGTGHVVAQEIHMSAVETPTHWKPLGAPPVPSGEKQ